MTSPWNSMDRTYLTCLTFLLLVNSLCALQNEECISTQYLELHHTGTIQCFFGEGSLEIYWYNSTKTVTKKPLLNFKESSKSGSGFTSGEYDIHPNGSLIINNVTVQHEHYFTVVQLNPSGDIVLEISVEIITTVHPHHDFPIITNCKGQNRACFLYVNETMQLACEVRDVRPMVSLTWSVRSISSDDHISSALRFENNTVRYTSYATTNITMFNTPFLRLHVCNSFSVPSLLGFQESYVIAEMGLLNSYPVESSPIYFKSNSEMKLFCNEGDFSFLVWKRTTEGGDANNVLAIFVNRTFQEVYSEDFEIDDEGSLIVRHVGTSKEGKYTCLFGNGLTEGKFVYQVVVYVHPEPQNPMITGCEDKPHCLLDIGNEGVLTCYINGIRPEVQLVLRPLHVVSSTTISFYNQKTNTKMNGDTFDVSTTINFLAKSAEDSRIALECKVVGPNTDLFDLSVQIDLWVKADNGTTVDLNKPIDDREVATLAIILPVIAFLIIVIATVIIVKVYFSVYRRRRVKLDQQMNVEEDVPMFSKVSRHTKNLKFADKKRKFIEELQIKYQRLYDVVQPIPYIKDKLYCVNTVFVECELETKIKRANEPTGSWEPVDSYNNMVNDARYGSMRTILQGDAGYGKSTLTLQLAYEWCNKVAPLEDVDILVLLRLRQLGRSSSIFEAIRQFLLPRDSTLTENDIKTIFQNTSKMLIILDGYDEYPYQEQGHETDILLIIKRDMLQKIPVILTTRSFCLPNDYPPHTKHFRLNGFNEAARERYIQNIVVGHDAKAAKQIRQRLAENPILSDLCKVPLFFVMFAHMTYDSDEFKKFNSVTDFFTYMISCFHSHMRNKIEDQAELEKFKQLEADHRKLDKLSLTVLSAKQQIEDQAELEKFKQFEADHRKLDKLSLTVLSAKQQIIWDKNDMISTIGQEFYEYYVKIGILVEEDALAMNKRSGLFGYKTEVRFYHKIFCEWYAAHLLSDYAADETSNDLRQTLKKLDPYELHYVYRFACGLQPKNAHNILKYLTSIPENQEFVALCTLEQMGDVEKIKPTIKYLSSDVVSLKHKNNSLQLRSIIQMLEIASTNSIQVPCVSIENCFQRVDCSTWKLSLGSGLFLSNLSLMKELRIYEVGRALNGKEIDDIYKFASHCLNLTTLRFECCLLPMTIAATKHDAHVNQNQIEVVWNPIGTWYCWNDSSNLWEDRYKKEPMTLQQYEKETQRFRNEWSHTYWQGGTNNDNIVSELANTPPQGCGFSPTARKSEDTFA